MARIIHARDTSKPIISPGLLGASKVPTLCGTHVMPRGIAAEDAHESAITCPRCARKIAAVEHQACATCDGCIGCDECRC